MASPRVVVDTNVIVAGLRSRRGASYRLLTLVGKGRFDIALSVPLVLEYEQALGEHATETGLGKRDIGEFLDYLCSVGWKQEIFFLWRPQLRDPKDEHVLELAVAARCESIVTFNRKDFEGAERFKIRVIDPKGFLKQIGALP